MCAQAQQVPLPTTGSVLAAVPFLSPAYLLAARAAKHLEVFALKAVEDRHGSNHSAAVSTRMLVKGRKRSRVSGILDITHSTLPEGSYAARYNSEHWFRESQRRLLFDAR